MASDRCVPPIRFRTFQIGDRACDFQNAMRGARAQRQALHGQLQQPAVVGIERAHLFDLFRAEPEIRHTGALLLTFARRLHTFPHLR